MRLKCDIACTLHIYDVSVTVSQSGVQHIPSIVDL